MKVEEKYLGMGMPSTVAMNDELKRATNIEDFLKKNKKYDRREAG